MIALLPLVAGLLPTLAKWIAPDTPAAATTAAAVGSVLEAVTGTRDPVQAQAIIEADPEKRAALIEALARIEAEREAAARQAELDTLRAGLADVADARARDVALQAQGHRNVRADVMVGLTILGIMACLWFLRSGVFPPGSDVSGAVLGLVGLLSKCFADAFQFEFGSSRGSADKSATLSAVTTTQAATAATVASTAATVAAAAMKSPADALNGAELARIRS
jgi:hypothetical protein